MATVKIWKIKSNLSKLVAYVTNKEKTLLDNNEEILKTLHTTIDYVSDENKTEQRLFVSGLNCQPEFAYEQMMETKNYFHKTDGILAFHSYQSFAPGEVSPEEAHRIGVEYAQKMWGDRFEVVIGTHLNTDCVHNHFLINSVSFLDGKKYNDCKANYALMRKRSDEICRAHNLSVIENPGESKRLSYAEYMEDKNNPISKNNIFRNDIDDCVRMSVVPSDFLYYMKKLGYDLDFTHKYAVIRHKNFKKAVRLRNLGENYTPRALDERIKANWTPERLNIPGQDNLIKDNLEFYDEESYQSVYVHFITIVNAVKTRPQYNRKYQKEFSEEVRKLDRLIEQQNLLCDNDIDTPEELSEFKDKIKSEIDELTEARNILRNKLRRQVRAGNTEEEKKTREYIEDLSGRLKELRRDLFICERIEKEEPRIKEKINDVRNIKERERRICHKTIICPEIQRS